MGHLTSLYQTDHHLLLQLGRPYSQVLPRRLSAESKIFSVALLLDPGLGLALSEGKQWWSLSAGGW